ncbi:purine-cytosine permease FCY21 [Absidia repens]|uniref:Purine-cytosine permease FCY21 n=1 Tax=Absidia repens TaxID=90262 RepID=A0A1X2IAC4_9FUNG|nr:purine-cytosine permease FCY21 [Absidia repens]
MDIPAHTKPVFKNENAYHVEIQGIHPVPSDQRTHRRLLDNLTIWFSINTTLANMSIGMLAIPVFGLGFLDSVACIIVFNMIVCVPGAFFVTLGQRYGLRQMVLTRYSFGLYGAILPVVINIVICIGWSIINVILGGQLLTSVSDDTLPMWAAILVLALVTVIISVFGYRVLHVYERWIWFPMWYDHLFITLAYGMKNMVNTPIPSTSGASEAGNVLSFSTSVVGFNPGWVTCASDYAVNQPISFNRRIVFILAFLGSFISSVLLQTLGVALTTALPQSPKYQTAWDNNGVGGLIGAVLEPLGGFGKVLLVLLAFSIVSCNVPNGYSVGLSIQAMSRSLQVIPQWVWTITATITYVLLSVFGAYHFKDILQNFLLILAYYCAPYAVIIAIEHGMVRKGVYNLDHWDKADRLPVGVAAMLALIVGFCGALVGMNQSWFVGPLAKLIGDHEGDIGFELAIALSALVYIPTRLYELRTTSR